MSRRLIVGIFVFIICICGLIQPAQAYLEGTKVKGAVLSKDYRGQFDWPDPVATISYTEEEFVREFTNVTTTADITEYGLTLTYENTSPWPNITYPPLTYVFEFEEENISNVFLIDSTFSHEIVTSFTSDSVTLEVGLQNTNPGEIFTARFAVIYCDELSK